jgi:exocyst complex component 5
MLDKFVNQVQSSTNPSLDSLKKLAGLDKKKQKDGKNAEPDFTEQDGALQLEMAKRMIKWHAEAIGRAAELTSHTEMCVKLCKSDFQGKGFANAIKCFI